MWLIAFPYSYNRSTFFIHSYPPYPIRITCNSIPVCIYLYLQYSSYLTPAFLLTPRVKLSDVVVFCREIFNRLLISLATLSETEHCHLVYAGRHSTDCSFLMPDFLYLCSSFLSQTEHCHRVFTGRHSTACSSRWRRRTLSSSSATSSPLLSGLSWHPSVVREKWDLQPDCRFLVNSFFDVHADDCNGWVAVASCILF